MKSSLCYYFFALTTPLVGCGAFFVSSPRPPRTTIALFSEEPTKKKAYKFGDFTKGLLKQNNEKKGDGGGYQFGDLTKGLLKQNNETKGDGGGYQFGDITKGLLKQNNEEKGDSDGDGYHFGDITKGLLKQGVEGVKQVTGQENYEFGDFSKWLDLLAKEKVGNYTGKEAYEFGDLTKEVVRRVWAGEYDWQDVWLVVRIMIAAGANLTPLAGALPVKMLIQLIEVGLAQEVGSKSVGMLASTLDEKFKLALTGDAKYQLGDKTKGEIEKALAGLTGKESYEFGDVSRKIMAMSDETQGKTKKKGQHSSDLSRLLSANLVEDIDNWDQKFQHEQESKKTK
jgi:hypothetical protein